MIKIIDIMRFVIEGQLGKNSHSFNVYTVALTFFCSIKKERREGKIFGLFLFSECHVGY
jgi:hypothetical protein